jgi:hypothetical protein
MRGKSWKIIFVVGITLLVWGVWIGDKAEHAIQGQSFEKESVAAQGVVVQLAHCLDGKSYGEYPLIQFRDATGKLDLAWDQSSCHDFTKGESVAVRYLSRDPTQIMTQSNIDANWSDLWLTAGIIAAISLPIAFFADLVLVQRSSMKRKKVV